jgi:hypothetical protein
MANAVTTQIIVDGARNAVVKVVGILDSSDLSATTIVDPASFTPLPTKFRIDQVQYSVEEGLSVLLDWDATSDVYIDSFDGSGTAKYHRFGGLTNNAGAGVTGKIEASTEGWASTGTYHFTLVLQMTKMGV